MCVCVCDSWLGWLIMTDASDTHSPSPMEDFSLSGPASLVCVEESCLHTPAAIEATDPNNCIRKPGERRGRGWERRKRKINVEGGVKMMCISVGHITKGSYHDYYQIALIGGVVTIAQCAEIAVCLLS